MSCYEINAKLDKLKAQIKIEKQKKQVKRYGRYCIYGITIDRVKLGVAPTKESLFKVLLDICDKAKLEVQYHKGKPYVAYEWKYKTKTIKYIHLHCMLKSKRKFIPYKDAIRKNYSIKLEKLKTPLDIIQWAAYIDKNKINEVDKPKQASNPN